ncbi:MAG: hypothetical protein FWE50_00280 [Alphaproteobacteria bacterium]|nr:hypothetical protein [Alphaproteobacteria bacterium]
MKTTKIALGLLLISLAPAAHANWEYSAPSGYFGDDGGRLTIAVRGGMAFGTGSIKNDLGFVLFEVDPGDPSLGYINIGDMPVAKSFSSFTWAGGVGIGWAVAGSPQWRLEANWDHIGQSDYNAAPMFRGDVRSSVGDLYEAEFSGVQSTVTTELFSAMAYYDFFDGLQKPIKEFIPYIGFGMGYAHSETVLNLTDIQGELLNQSLLADFEDGLGGFYTSTTTTNNVALSGALGFSYGLAENVFLDLGLRLLWVPKIQWALNNELANSPAGEKSKDVFSVHNAFYGMAMAGIRFEF